GTCPDATTTARRRRAPREEITMPTWSPPRPPADLGTPEIVRSITDVVLEIPADLPHAARFDDHDVDSLVLAEAAVVVTRLYGVEVHEWELRDAGTLQGVADVVRERVAEIGRAHV